MREIRNLVWLAAEGIVVGILASYLSRMTKWSDVLLDSIAGASGSLFLAGFISPLNNAASVFDWSSLLLSALGAAFVIGPSCQPLQVPGWGKLPTMFRVGPLSITSEERFRTVCPCAAVIEQYVADLLNGQGVSWHFGRAIVRPTHTSAMFLCIGLAPEPWELWVSAMSDGLEGWTLQRTQLPAQKA